MRHLGRLIQGVCSMFLRLKCDGMGRRGYTVHPSCVHIWYGMLVDNLSADRFSSKTLTLLNIDGICVIPVRLSLQGPDVFVCISLLVGKSPPPPRTMLYPNSRHVCRPSDDPRLTVHARLAVLDKQISTGTIGDASPRSMVSTHTDEQKTMAPPSFASPRA